MRAVLPKNGRAETNRTKFRTEISLEVPIAVVVTVHAEREDGQDDGVDQSEVGERQQADHHRLGEVSEIFFAALLLPVLDGF